MKDFIDDRPTEPEDAKVIGSCPWCSEDITLSDEYVVLFGNSTLHLSCAARYALTGSMYDSCTDDLAVVDALSCFHAVHTKDYEEMEDN